MPVFCSTHAFLSRLDSPSGPSHCRGSKLHWVGLLWVSDWPVAETSTWDTQHKATDIHSTGAIRTSIPSKRATADPRLRRRGHRDWIYTHVATSDYGIRNYETTSFSGWLLIIRRNLPPALSTLKVQVGFPKIWSLLMIVSNFQVQRESGLSNKPINNLNEIVL